MLKNGMGKNKKGLNFRTCESSIS